MIKVYLEYAPAFAGMKCWISDEGADGIYIAEPIDLNFKKQELGTIHPPTFRFDHHKGDEFLQGFAGALVKAGFKPDEIKAHDKEIEATIYHLEDMRKLVFKNK